MKNNGKKGSRGKRVARKFWLMTNWGMEHVNIIPAGRGMAPMSPKTFANPICAETNAFWELKQEVKALVPPAFGVSLLLRIFGGDGWSY